MKSRDTLRYAVWLTAVNGYSIYDLIANLSRRMDNFIYVSNVAYGGADPVVDPIIHADWFSDWETVRIKNLNANKRET